MFIAGVVSKEVMINVFILHVPFFFLFISAIAVDFNAHVFGYFGLAHIMLLVVVWHLFGALALESQAWFES